MKFSSVLKSIFTMTAVALSVQAMAAQNIKGDISAISFNLKSEQIFTIKNYSNGNFKELAFTRIERPSLIVKVNTEKNSESYNVEVQESLLTEKTGLLNINLNKSGLANFSSESNSSNSKINVLSKLNKSAAQLKTKDAAKIFKKDIIANINRIVTRIGFRDETKLSYNIKSISLECPKLSGRITNCRGSYEVEAIIKNDTKKQKESNLLKILADSKMSFKSLGPEIEINTYIGELRSINKQLSDLGKIENKDVKLQKLYSLKKDVQSEILDSYQYTAISSTSALAFIDGLGKKITN